METLEKIQDCLQKDTQLNGIGVSNGLLGKSLFYYYNYLYTQKEEWLEKSIGLIEDSLEMLTDNYTSISPQKDIIEAGIYLNILFKNNVLANEVEFILNDLSSLIDEIFINQLKDENLDSITGVFAPIQYYFVSEKISNEKLNQVLDLVIDKAIENENQAYWLFDLRSPENSYVELGYNHGVAGVISFLIDCYAHNVRKEECKNLISKGLNFLEKHLDRDHTSWFPQTANKNNKLQYHNLSYGDLGIGYTFYRAGNALKNSYWTELGIEILENAAEYKDDNDSHIRDANMIYGASGLYAFFDMMYRLTSKNAFKESKDYWFQKILDKGNNNTVWAGYDTYYNGIYDFAQLGISQGILGIGLTLLCKELDIKNEYLNFLNFRK
ncbi:lantibiotic biosynthesis protein [Tenacibaculum sp. 190524A05c]|uniref:lanthionine synthetase LanC family protein n=1 Tax=Tenacibaculum platacis TaxID=3137852 RepID=UPI0031FADF1D